MHLSSSFSPTMTSSHGPMQVALSSNAPTSSTPSQSSIPSRGKRKRSVIADLDNQGSLKHRGARKSLGINAPASKSVILHGFQGSMNHFSDVVHTNNKTQPHTIFRDATSKLNGAWGIADKFTDGQKIILLKLFHQNQAKASLYASTENSWVCHGYALSELELFKNEVDNYGMDNLEI